jgi:hypothetical protein
MKCGPIFYLYFCFQKCERSGACAHPMFTANELQKAELYFFVTDLNPSSFIPPSPHGHQQAAGRCPRELAVAAASLVSVEEEKKCVSEEECPSIKSNNAVSRLGGAWEGRLKLVGHWTLEESLEQSLRVPVFPSTRRNSSLFAVFFLLPKGRSLHPADYPLTLPALQNGCVFEFFILKETMYFFFKPFPK